MSLQNRHIILGVCAGIAAYKSVELASQLSKLGASVHPVLTDNASNFVAPLSLEVMTQNKVYQKQYDNNLGHIDHIELADRADLVLIAPATANTIAKLANGISDNLLLDLCLVTRAPILIAPAMNTKMWQHPTVLRNISYLKSIGYEFIDPDYGLLACGYTGEGRLADLERIVAAVTNRLAANQSAQSSPKQGPKILITMGATREAIDPVRHITNRSSGRMGEALARAALEVSAEVTVITTVEVSPDLASRLRVIQVESAREMLEACLHELPSLDICFMAAAVADFTLANPSPTKHKKSTTTNNLVLDLLKTPDIVAELASRKQAHQKIIGFALESEDLESNARQKLISKKLDFIIANPVKTLSSDEIEMTIISDSFSQSYPLMSKTRAAQNIMKLVDTKTI